MQPQTVVAAIEKTEVSNPKRIAIAGGTGYIGGRLAPRLLDYSYTVRCLVRSPRKLEGRKWAQNARVEIELTDVADAESVALNPGGCEVAFYAADWLWRIRGWMDVPVGGPSLRRDHRDPEMVGYGEALDFWRVIGINILDASPGL